MIEEDLTKTIIGAAMEVHNVLGYGFLEAVYGNALYQELTSRGLSCVCQKPLDVYYKGRPVGHYRPDMVVEDKVIIELKAVKDLHPEHEWQIINYLAASKVEVGLLLNFGESLEYKRKVFSNNRKRNNF